MAFKIKQAAFRSTDGEVHGTGPLHNVEALPNGFQVAEEGFLTDTGDFVSREQATQELHVDHPIQSEELDLQKSLGVLHNNLERFYDRIEEFT